ncbi:MAG: hypothetical protein M0R03_06770 [Novosphingobium sp.]|nr:hypothetical protein [Novosphingobium sp.]
MNLTRDRARSLGWALILSVCFALTIVLTFRVNAVKSQVRLTERQIVALKKEKLFLETEFEARASQQQLRNLNAVEFGYEAPGAAQYLEGERQLALLGKPRAPDAPEPIRVASAVPVGDGSGFPAMVSPLTGKALAAEVPESGPREPTDAAGLKARLVRLDSDVAAGQAGGGTDEKAGQE